MTLEFIEQQRREELKDIEFIGKQKDACKRIYEREIRNKYNGDSLDKIFRNKIINYPININ
jgi:hypothetical protein